MPFWTVESAHEEDRAADDWRVRSNGRERDRGVAGCQAGAVGGNDTGRDDRDATHPARNPGADVATATRPDDVSNAGAVEPADSHPVLPDAEDDRSRDEL